MLPAAAVTCPACDVLFRRETRGGEGREDGGHKPEKNSTKYMYKMLNQGVVNIHGFDLVKRSNSCKHHVLYLSSLFSVDVCVCLVA